MGDVGRREDDSPVCWCVSERPRRFFCYGILEQKCIMSGSEAPGPISSMAMDGDAVWVASGSYAIQYLRGKEVSCPAKSSAPSYFSFRFGCACAQVSRLSNPFGTSLSYITVFGSQVLALSEDGSKMFIWEPRGTSRHNLAGPDNLSLRLTLGYIVPQSTIGFDVGFSAVSILHPATYLNKVLVASSQGGLQLWNIRTRSAAFSSV